jgi:hypothetical protein
MLRTSICQSVVAVFLTAVVVSLGFLLERVSAVAAIPNGPLLLTTPLLQFYGF